MRDKLLANPFYRDYLPVYNDNIPHRRRARLYARSLVRQGKVPPERFREVADCLLIAAAFCRYGEEAGERYEMNRRISRRASRKRLQSIHIFPTRPRGGQESYALRGYLWAAGVIWTELGHHVGTAWDWRDAVEASTPFERFASGWLKVIEPKAAFPSAKVIRHLKAKFLF